MGLFSMIFERRGRKPKDRSKGLVVRNRSNFFDLKRILEMPPNLDLYESYYKKIPYIASFVNTTVEHAIGVGFKVKADTVDAEQKIMEFFDETNFFSKLINIGKQMLIYGNAYLEVIRNDRGEIVNCKILNPKTIEVERDEKGRVIGYYQHLSKFPELNFDTKTREVFFEPDEIVHFKWNVIADAPYGTSIVEPLRAVIANMLELEEYYVKIVGTYASPTVVWKFGNDNYPIKEDDIDDFMSNWENRNYNTDIGVPHYVEPMVIGAKGSIIDPSQLFKHLQDQIVVGAGTPNAVLGLAENATEATANVQLTAFDRRIATLQKIIAEQVQDYILKPLVGADVHPKLVFRDVDRAERQEKRAEVLELLKYGVISIEKAQEMLDIHDPKAIEAYYLSLKADKKSDSDVSNDAQAPMKNNFGKQVKKKRDPVNKKDPQAVADKRKKTQNPTKKI